MCEVDFHKMTQELNCDTWNKIMAGENLVNQRQFAIIILLERKQNRLITKP